MGTNSRIEDVTLKLGSTGHHELTGIVFGGTTTNNAKMRTTILTVDNSSASSSGTSNVYGINCNGVGTAIAAGSFAFNSLKGSTVNIYSNGNGKKRGILVSNTNTVTTRDMNVYVAQPGNTGSSGSYVGVETNDTVGATALGSIQLRTTTIGCVYPTIVSNYTASDILQTTSSTIVNPTYLATPGIKVGPGVDLVTKSAGSKAFSTYIYPTIVYYGLKGSITAGPNSTVTAWAWPGTQAFASSGGGSQTGIFPDSSTPPAFFRIQQPTLLSGISASLNTGPNGTNSVTVSVAYTPVGNTYQTNYTVSPFVIGLTGGSTGPVSSNFYNASTRLNTGDLLHLQVAYTTNTSGSGTNTATDLSVQLDLF